uniref:Uncharacterized protein n=1 Tax=Panagrellus redivivus TaxID=6233 RepID=A0A7E4V466_PANRE
MIHSPSDSLPISFDLLRRLVTDAMHALSPERRMYLSRRPPCPLPTYIQIGEGAQLGQPNRKSCTYPMAIGTRSVDVRENHCERNRMTRAASGHCVDGIVFNPSAYSNQDNYDKMNKSCTKSMNHRQKSQNLLRIQKDTVKKRQFQKAF